MNETEIVDQYWARARKLARQYETSEIAFADLSGFVEAFAASLTKDLNALPESQRTATSSIIEAKLEAAIESSGADSVASQAYDELLVSINRTPIY